MILTLNNILKQTLNAHFLFQILAFCGCFSLQLVENIPKQKYLWGQKDLLAEKKLLATKVRIIKIENPKNTYFAQID